MIHLLVKDIFGLINNSPSSTEYIVRCSFIEIYLERVLDLLHPTNRTVQILSGLDGGKRDSGDCGCSLMGASEACCIDESDVVSLLARGNACRTVSSTRLNTDSSRSHAVFIMKIEQK
jgi:kinesin family protein 5